MVGAQRHAPTALTPGEIPGTHRKRGWVGPRAGLDRRAEKSFKRTRTNIY